MRTHATLAHIATTLLLLSGYACSQYVSNDRPASVRDFGAKCDGTADDTFAINSAIQQVSAAPRRLTLPEGTCRITGPIRILTPMVHLEGWGNGSVIEADYSHWRDKEDFAALQVLNTDAWVSIGRPFRDFSIRGVHNDDVLSTAISIRSLNNWKDGGHYVDGILIDNVHVSGFDTGFQISDLIQSVFRFVQVDQCRVAFSLTGEVVNTQFEHVFGTNFTWTHTSSKEPSVGFVLDSRSYPDGKSRLPEGLTLSDSVFVGADTALYVKRAFFFVASHNIFDLSHGDNVVIEDPNGFRLEGNYISVDSAERSAVLVRSPGEHIDGLFITGNYINGLGKHFSAGIRFQPGKQRRGVSIERNQFIGLTVPMYFHVAPESGTIRDNYGSGNSSTFISIEGDAELTRALLIDGNISSDRHPIVSSRAKGFTLGTNASSSDATGTRNK